MRQVIELRAGDGGADAEQFASELADAFTRHVQRAGGTVKDVTSGRTVTLQVDGPADLERFAGIHRVQRIPKNDRKGRRHTSTVTVAVLDPAASARSKMTVDPKHVEFEPFRSSGPGGQHRNKTQTAIRATHRPSGVTVTVDGRSQHANRQEALRELGERLTVRARERRAGRRNDARSSQFDPEQVGARTFVHNFQRDETVDKLSGQRWRLRDFLAGKLN